MARKLSKSADTLSRQIASLLTGFGAHPTTVGTAGLGQTFPSRDWAEQVYKESEADTRAGALPSSSPSRTDILENPVELGSVNITPLYPELGARASGPQADQGRRNPGICPLLICASACRCSKRRRGTAAVDERGPRVPISRT
jgi:hypothetical protein